MPLDVIGAGLGRTGTRTLKEALQILGVGRTYHMSDLFEAPDGLVHWHDAAEGRSVDWEALFDGYRAVVDYPGALHWRALQERYPAAKVILTVRPAADWYDSTLATIRHAASHDWPEPVPTVLRAADGWIWEGLFEGRFEDRERAIAIYEQHVASVLAGVPEERRLVYEVAEGWGPLAAFLGVPEPEVPFPHHNTRAAFVARLRGR